MKTWTSKSMGVKRMLNGLAQTGGCADSMGVNVVRFPHTCLERRVTINVVLRRCHLGFYEAKESISMPIVQLRMRLLFANWWKFQRLRRRF